MSLDLSTIYKDEEERVRCIEVETGNDIIIDELFPIEDWDCPEAFKSAEIRGYEPMTAKELETEEQQDEKLDSSEYYIEEKFDGTRALVYFLAQENMVGTSAETLEAVKEEVGYCRVFSRRISKKTNFYVENSDSLPHIRELNRPELKGTILDGEMFIEGLPFKEVASTLNCKWDKALDRQIEKGFVTFHAFDILFYHGIDLRKMPLERRKVYLHLAVEEADSEYIKEVEYFECGKEITSDAYTELMKRIDMMDEDPYFDSLEDFKESYPNLYKCFKEDKPLTPRAYYELIVSTGGEGVIVKPKKGKYLHKRGWEYSKIKSFLTREMIVMGFTEPTKEYTGKDIKKWGYWVRNSDNKRVQGNFYGDKNYTPVTKNYFHSKVGNLILGVLITPEQYNSIPKNKKGNVIYPHEIGLCHFDTYDENYLVMEVCECSGFDDDTRDYFTRNKDKMIGTVVEVKANGIFKDSGKLRHPRYLRQRFDKSAEQCTWSDHVS